MTSTIIVRTDSKLKAKAQKTAADLGLTLSAVINNQLKKFVEEKSFSVSELPKSGKKKYKDPYGMFAGATISEKDIKEVTDSWMKTVNEFR